MSYNQRNTMNSTREYVYGSAAPKIYTPQKRNVEVQKKNKVRAVRISPAVMVTWMLVFVFFAAACGAILTAQYSRNNYVDKISELENQIADTKAENNLNLARINESIDFYAIQQEAGRLGMIKLTPDKIIDVEYSGSEYVRQYKSVP